jgi:hypothetical protein
MVPHLINSAGSLTLDLSHNSLPTPIGVRLSKSLLESIQELAQGAARVRDSVTAMPQIFALDISANTVTIGFVGYLDLSHNQMDHESDACRTDRFTSVGGSA